MLLGNQQEAPQPVEPSDMAEPSKWDRFELELEAEQSRHEEELSQGASAQTTPTTPSGSDGAVGAMKFRRLRP